MTQLQVARSSLYELLVTELEEMKGLKFMETLVVTFEKELIMIISLTRQRTSTLRPRQSPRLLSSCWRVVTLSNKSERLKRRSYILLAYGYRKVVVGLLIVLGSTM